MIIETNKEFKDASKQIEVLKGVMKTGKLPNSGSQQASGYSTHLNYSRSLFLQTK